MHSTHRSPSWGTSGNILIIILILTTIIVSIHARNEYAELKEISDALSVTVNKQTSTIKSLEEENTSLNTTVSELEEENKRLKEENTKLQAKTQVTTQVTTQVSKKDFKSYMPYTAITNKSSTQWKLQQSATTDENGLRCIDGKPMVAVGTGWGVSVGDSAVITCDNGNSFEVVIGDIKANQHTNAENKTTSSNNCRCEFIVDSRQLNPTVKTMGNVAVLGQYNGYVINVQKI